VRAGVRRCETFDVLLVHRKAFRVRGGDGFRIQLASFESYPLSAHPLDKVTQAAPDLKAAPSATEVAHFDVVLPFRRHVIPVELLELRVKVRGPTDRRRSEELERAC